MAGVNKVILVGNIGNEVEFRTMPNGKGVVNLSIATSESWKDKTSGERQEKTEWHRVIFFDRLAEICQQYLKKGSKIYVEGRLQTRDYMKGEVKCYVTEIVASSMQMLDSSQAEPKAANWEKPENHKPSSQPMAPKNFDNFDDDIPF